MASPLWRRWAWARAMTTVDLSFEGASPCGDAAGKVEGLAGIAQLDVDDDRVKLHLRGAEPTVVGVAVRADPPAIRLASAG